MSEVTVIELITMLLDKALLITKGNRKIEEETPVARSYRVMAKMFIKVAVYEIDMRCQSGQPRAFQEQWNAIRGCLLLTAGRRSGKHSSCPAGAGCLLRDCDRAGATAVKYAEVRKALIKAYDPRRQDGTSHNIHSILTPDRAIVIDPQESNPLADAREYISQLKSSACHYGAAIVIAVYIFVAIYELTLNPSYDKTIPPIGLFILTCLTVACKTTDPSFYSIVLALSPTLGIHAVLVVPCWLVFMQETEGLTWRVACGLLWIVCGVANSFYGDKQGLLVAAIAVMVVLLSLLVSKRDGLVEALVKKSEAGVFYRSVVGKILHNFDFTAAADLVSIRSSLLKETASISSIIDKIQYLPNTPPELSAHLDSLAFVNKNVQSLCTMSAKEQCLSDAESNEPPSPRNQEDDMSISTKKLKQIYTKAKGSQSLPCGSELAHEIRQDPAIRSLLLLPLEVLETRNLLELDKSLEATLSHLDYVDDEKVPWEEFINKIPEAGKRTRRGGSVYSGQSVTPNSVASSKLRGITPTSGRKSPKFLTRTFSVNSDKSDKADKVEKQKKQNTIVGIDLHMNAPRHKRGKVLSSRAASGLDSHVGIVLLNSDTKDIGSIVCWNQYMETTSALKAVEVEGIPFYTLLTSEREQMNISGVINSVLNGETCDSLTLSFIKKDGDRVVYTVNVAACYSNSRGNEIRCGVMLMCTVQSQDHGSKAKLIEWLVDYIRHPLITAHASIKRHRKTLAEGKLSERETLSILDHVASQTKKLAALTKQLRPLASITLSQHPMAFNATLTSIIADHQKAAQIKNIDLQLSINPTLPSSIYADSEKLTESISYLVFCAIEQSRAGGWVRLEVTCAKEDQDSVGTVIIKVKDSSQGLKPDRLKTMFQPGRIWHGGQGDEVDWDLGMCNVKLVIEEMGGIMDVESMCGEGTEFTIFLPLVPVEGSLSEQTAGDAPVCTSKYTCLVMESNNIKRTAICSHLWQNKCAVMLASNASAIVNNVKSFDVLFYGLHSTNRTGFNDTMEKLVKPSSELEIVLMADKSLASQLPASIERAINEGRIHLLTTPVIGSELAAILRKIEKRINERTAKLKELTEVRKALSERSLPWVRGKLLGTGTHGKVYQANKSKSGGVMAVKIITVGDDAQVKNILKEITVMSRLQHPNIIHYFYCEKTGADLHLFMEYAPGGSLAKKICKSPLEINQIKRYLGQILMGLAFLHENNVIHRDLKPANILIGEGGICKIADFGCALQMEDATTPDFATNGTVLYMAPEVLKGNKHDWRVDIWSVGCIVMELFSGKVPFSHIGGMMKVMGVHLSGDAEVNIGGLDLYRFVKEGREFAALCLQKMPLKRPSAVQLHSHPLLLDNKLQWNETDTSVSVQTEPPKAVSSFSKSFDPCSSEDIRGLFIKPNYATGVPPVPHNLEAQPPPNSNPPEAFLNLGPLYSLDEDDDDDLDETTAAGGVAAD